MIPQARRKGGLAALAALAALVSATAWAAPFQNGSFELGDDPGSVAGRIGPPPANAWNIPGWTVTARNIDYIGTFWVAADGARSIDLNGSRITSATGGVLEQTFDTVAGQQYRVDFSMAGNPEDVGGTPCSGIACIKEMAVQATGSPATTYTFDANGHSLANMGWTAETYTFTATGTSTTLSFSSLVSGNFGPALDNVRVTELTPTTPSSATSTVPVPTLPWHSLLLLSLMLALLARGSRSGTAKPDTRP